MDPVAHVLSRAVKLWADTTEDVRYLAGDELLHVLVGAVVVRAVGDGGANTVGAVPRTHKQVRARLGGAVRTRGPVWVVRFEAPGFVETQIPIDLVRAHVVVADIIPPRYVQ